MRCSTPCGHASWLGGAKLKLPPSQTPLPGPACRGLQRFSVPLAAGPSKSLTRWPLHHCPASASGLWWHTTGRSRRAAVKSGCLLRREAWRVNLGLAVTCWDLIPTTAIPRSAGCRCLSDQPPPPSRSCEFLPPCDPTTKYPSSRSCCCCCCCCCCVCREQPPHHRSIPDSRFDCPAPP